MASGNDYVAWLINADNQLIGVLPGGDPIVKSGPDFAYDIGISEDGTIWVISTQADPVNGGALIFWGTGDGNWNLIQKPTKEAMKICGTTAGACIYLAEDGDIVQMNTSGTSYTLIPGSAITDFDYGGGYYWAILPDQAGGIPSLHYAKVSPAPINWQPFKGAPDPTSVTVDYEGNGYGVVDYTVMFYDNDGSTSGVYALGADGVVLQVSCKNWSYALSTKAEVKGNEVLIWADENGGMWVGTNMFGIKVLATYYLAS